MALTPKQRHFVVAYLKSFNATRAAREAQYSPRTACHIGWENLRKPQIQEALLSAMANVPEITPERVLQELARMAFVDIRKFYDAQGKLKPLDMLDDETAAALASVEVFEHYAENGDVVGSLKKLKTWDKLRATELLGKYLKLFSERVELTGRDGAPLAVTVVPQLSEALQLAYEPVQKELNGHVTYSTR